MTRTVDSIQGLSLGGAARVAGLEFDVPALATPGPAADSPRARLSVAVGTDAPIGRRKIVLANASAALELDLPVLAPEVSGTTAAAVNVGPESWLVHAPLDPATVGALRGAHPGLIVLGNARALWEEGEAFVHAIGQLRRELGGAPVLWAPRVALPHRVPLLHYLGIDLVDTTGGLLAVSAGQRFDETLGSDPTRALAPHGDLEAVEAELLASYGDAVDRSRRAARAGRLRELVEARLVAEPALAEMLRYADRDLSDLLEERAPVLGAGVGRYVLSESLRRPEVRRFRARLLERYRPPQSKEVLLLVPCSRTKPYRNSRSHRRFAAALEGLGPLERVHKVSLSSPVGVVPRELEDLPPAAHYDIAVTGDWSEAEREMIARGLEHLLQEGSYRAIVAHLDPEEYGFVREALSDRLPATWTIPDGRTTTAEALASLRAAVAGALAASRPVPGGPLAVVREELRELAAVQFGRTAADRLFAEGTRLAGRPWAQRLTDERHRDLATWREERGLFQLTVAGAQRLMPDPPLGVEVAPGLELTGDLFVPGVRNADPGIRVGDAVVLVRAGALLGVGEALLPGRLMLELGRGAAVRVRHRVHVSTDTPMMVERSSPDSGPVV